MTRLGLSRLNDHLRIVTAALNVDEGMYRYRLLDQRTGADLGPFVSTRLAFQPGETLTRSSGERFELVNVVEPENENFRAYLVVRPLDASISERPQME